MNQWEDRFAALSRRMHRIGVPPPVSVAHPSIASLIDRVEARRQRYETPRG